MNTQHFQHNQILTHTWILPTQYVSVSTDVSGPARSPHAPPADVEKYGIYVGQY